jgi:hypothetical protein
MFAGSHGSERPASGLTPALSVQCVHPARAGSAASLDAEKQKKSTAMEIRMQSFASPLSAHTSTLHIQGKTSTAKIATMGCKQ